MIIVNDEEVNGSIAQDDSATHEERLFLYALLRAIKPKVAVEIGTHRGLAATYMANALFDNFCANPTPVKPILHTTDPFDYEQATNLTKFHLLKDFVKVHHIPGKDLEVDNVDFLFVDGFHEEEHVLAEMEHFLPRLTENAVVIFHDCGGDNVQVGVNAAIKKLGLETAFLPTGNTMRIYGKFKPKN